MLSAAAFQVDKISHLNIEENIWVTLYNQILFVNPLTNNNRKLIDFISHQPC